MGNGQLYLVEREHLRRSHGVGELEVDRRQRQRHPLASHAPKREYPLLETAFAPQEREPLNDIFPLVSGRYSLVYAECNARKDSLHRNGFFDVVVSLLDSILEYLARK